MDDMSINSNPIASKDLKKKQEELLKSIMISTAEDYLKSLDKCLETWNMEQCIYNLGYAAYFINRGLNTKEIEDKWKEVFDKALDIAKKIELHNFEEMKKVQDEINQKAKEEK